MFCWFPNKVNCLSAFIVDFCFDCKFVFIWTSFCVDVDVRLLHKLNDEEPACPWSSIFT